jgi:FtsX-like permease family protein
VIGERFILRRALSEKTLALAACATALFATTVLAALLAYTGSVTDEGLRRTLAGASFASAGTVVTTHINPGDYPRTERSLQTALASAYGGIPRATTLYARGDSYTLPGQERLEHPELTTFATYSGIERHASLTAGTWPRPAPTGTVEAALPTAAARAMKVGAGDTLTLHSRLDRSAVRVRVTGLFQVDDARDYVWQGGALVTSGVERLGFTTYGPLVVPPDTFADRFAGTGFDARWLVLPRLQAVSATGLRDLGRRLNTLATDLRTGRTGHEFIVGTNLPALLAQVDGAVLVARSTMLIPVLQLTVLAGYALMLVARLIAEHRQREVALLRARGAGTGQLSRLILGEGILLTAPGAVAAPLLAPPLLDLAGRIPLIKASGLRLDAAPSASLWIVSIAAALACAFTLALPALHGVARSYVAESTRRGRGERRGVLQRAGADLALLVVAGLGVWQLTRYGGPVTGEGTAAAGVDPFIVTGPALALLAGGALLLRLVPVAATAVERLTSRGRGLAAALGARQVSRRPLRYARPALLLVMAVAVGVLSVATEGTWRRSQVDQADFQAGADLRVATPAEPAGPLALGQGGRLAGLPGVTALSPMLRRPASAGDQEVTLLAGDAAVLGRLLRARPDTMDRSITARLAAARPRTALPTVPGRPDQITFDLRVTPRGGNGGGAPPTTAFEVFVTVTDGLGVTREIDLGELQPDGRTRTRSVATAALAGPGGRITFPLTVRSVRYQVGEDPGRPELELSVGAEGVAAPAGSTWHAFATDARTPDLVGNSAAGTLVTLVVPKAVDERSRTRFGIGGATVAAPAGRVSPTNPPQPASRAAPGTGSAIAPIPGIISSELARRARVGVGGTVAVGDGGDAQPVTVTAVVPALPATAPDRPAVLVDLPTLTDRLLSAGRAVPEPSEWWLAVRNGDTAPAAHALAAHQDWSGEITDRMAMRRQLSDAPLGAALQGALLIGFLAALAFAVIGFAVNATVSVRERASEFAILRALGAGPRQVLGLLSVEQAFLGALGLAGGTVLGLAVAYLVVPHVVLTIRAGTPYPPVDMVISWPPVLGLLGGVVLLLVAVLAVALRRAGRGIADRIGVDA